MSGRRIYGNFHGKKAPRPALSDFRQPRELVELGRAVAVIYESDKRHGGGDGKKSHYYHEFDTPVLLCADERGKKQLFLLGRNVKVTPSGIIG